jgi:hypothetical protein
MPNLDELARILEADEIPVVSIDYTEGKSKFVVSAVSKTDSQSYIAVSHVWVDGMGGTPAQGLLRCQAQSLHTLIVQAPGSIGAGQRFWLDTLCIPRTPQEAYDLAMVGIRDVYSCASTTLVVDRLIRTCPIQASTEIIYAHIYMSAWMQRMWTYEEAVLSRKLVFVLKDDTFHTFSCKSLPSTPRAISTVGRTLAAQLYRLRAETAYVNIGHIY